MAGNIILIAGLPGSGKTTYMDGMRRDGWTIFYDFKDKA
jgi:broad-specificity NMP kinase